MIDEQRKKENLPDITPSAASALLRAIEVLDGNYLDEEGIFRLSGSSKEVER